MAESLRDDLLDRLDRAYPAFNGHWRIEVDAVGGVVQVTNVLLSGKWGFLLHITKIDPEGKRIIKSAGELLERYSVSRAKNFDIYELLGKERDHTGDLIVDKS